MDSRPAMGFLISRRLASIPQLKLNTSYLLKAGRTTLSRGCRYGLKTPLLDFLYLTRLQNGITHGFVVEFSSVEDRDYYTKTDPSHQAFVKGIWHLVEKAIVVDFINGVY
jgi:hypothetical protein